MASTGRGDEFSAELLENLRQQSQVLGVIDEGQSVALDLHEAIFDVDARARALAFLQSSRYEAAAQQFIELRASDVPDVDDDCDGSGA